MHKRVWYIYTYSVSILETVYRIGCVYRVNALFIVLWKGLEKTVIKVSELQGLSPVVYTIGILALKTIAIARFA